MVELVVESWIWYGVGMLIVISRFISRSLLLGGVKNLQLEDWIMGATACFYTILLVFINMVVSLNTNLMLPTDIPTLTLDDVQSRIYGSKLVLLVEQSMILTIWGCKCCLLLMYAKLTMGLRQHLAVKIVGGYIAVAFVVMEIFYFGVWCRPFQNYWAVPTPDVQCSAAIHHLIMQACFNISSDVMMLCIPLPLLIRSTLPKKKKLILCGIFGLGSFVILSACLNKYYSFTQPFSPIWTFWYVREASTAIFVANLPNCWTFFRRVFHVGTFGGSTNRSRTDHSQNARRTVYNPSAIIGKPLGRGGEEHVNRWTRMKDETSESNIALNGLPLEIWAHTHFKVEEEDIEKPADIKDDSDGNETDAKDPYFVSTTVTASSPESPKKFMDIIP